MRFLQPSRMRLPRETLRGATQNIPIQLKVRRSRPGKRREPLHSFFEDRGRATGRIDLDRQAGGENPGMCRHPPP